MFEVDTQPHQQITSRAWPAYGTLFIPTLANASRPGFLPLLVACFSNQFNVHPKRLLALAATKNRQTPLVHYVMCLMPHPCLACCSAAVYTAANISGGHLNPAVTISSLLCGEYRLCMGRACRVQGVSRRCQHYLQAQLGPWAAAAVQRCTCCVCGQPVGACPLC